MAAFSFDESERPLYEQVIPMELISIPTSSEVEIVRLAFLGAENELVAQVSDMRSQLGIAEKEKLDDEDEEDEDEEEDDELATWMNTIDSNGVNALIAACSGGHIHCLKVILDAGGDMDSVDIEGRTGSFMASLRGGLGHQECVLELMRQGGDLELQTNNHRWTILHATACSGSVDICRMILTAAEEDELHGDQHPIRARDALGRTPLHIACYCGYGPFVDALLTDVHRDRDELSPPNAGVQGDVFIMDSYEMNCFHMACGRGHVDVARMLMRHLTGDSEEEGLQCIKENVETRDKMGWRPLHHAAAHGHLQVCIYLREVTRGELDVLARTNSGLTPLHLACLNGHSNVVDWMLELEPLMELQGEGLSNLVDCRDRTCLHAAAHSRQGDRSIACVQSLLKAEHPLEDMDMEGNTPLFYTAGQSNEGGSGIATTLLLSDADTRVKNNQGKTVWHYWAQNGDIDTIRFSLRRCQVLYDSHELVSLLNSKDNRGLTPLHHAALYCVDDFSAISEVVQLFVTDASASIDSSDNYDRTPFLCACLSGNANGIRIFSEEGARVNGTDQYGRSGLLLLLHSLAHPLNSTPLGMDDVDAALQALFDSAGQGGFWDDLVAMRDRKGQGLLHYLGRCCLHPASQVKDALGALSDSDFSGQFHLDDAGRHPALYAFQSGDVEYIEWVVGVCGEGRVRGLKDNGGCSHVHYAAAGDNTGSTVQWLIDHDYNFLETDGQGRTCAHLATAAGNLSFLREVLPRSPELLLTHDKRGRLPMHYAAMYSPINPLGNHSAGIPSSRPESSLTLVNLLLEYGFQREQLKDRDQALNTPGHLNVASFNDHGSKSGLLNDETWRVLISEVCSVDPYFDWKNSTGQTPLHYCMMASNYPDLPVSFLRDIVIKNNLLETMMTYDQEGRSPLHWACRYKQPGFVTLVAGMLEVQALIKPDHYGCSPLMTAARYGAADCVSILLDALTRTAEKSSAPMPPWDKDVAGRLAIHVGAKFGHVDVCRKVLEYQADRCVRDPQGKLAIHYACKFGQLDVVKFLMSGRREEQNDAVDAKGRSSLMFAAWGGHHEIVKFLIDHDADCFLRDHEDKRPIDFCESSKYPICYAILKDIIGDDETQLPHTRIPMKPRLPEQGRVKVLRMGRPKKPSFEGGGSGSQGDLSLLTQLSEDVSKLQMQFDKVNSIASTLTCGLSRLEERLQESTAQWDQIVHAIKDDQKSSQEVLQKVKEIAEKAQRQQEAETQKVKGMSEGLTSLESTMGTLSQKVDSTIQPLQQSTRDLRSQIRALQQSSRSTALEMKEMMSQPESFLKDLDELKLRVDHLSGAVDKLCNERESEKSEWAKKEAQWEKERVKDKQEREREKKEREKKDKERDRLWNEREKKGKQGSRGGVAAPNPPPQQQQQQQGSGGGGTLQTGVVAAVVAIVACVFVQIALPFLNLQ